MDIILLEKIRKLGNLGEQVSVKAGYARNYLIPQQKAVFATKENVAHVAEKRAELEKSAAELLASAQQRAAQLEQQTINIAVRASEDGKLFGSIGVRDLAIAISETGTQVDKHEIQLPNGPIHYIGEHEVNLQLHSDVVVTVKVEIVAK